MKIVDTRIAHFENNFVHNDLKTSVPRIKKKLEDLAKLFAFVPADKAANNVILV